MLRYHVPYVAQSTPPGGRAGMILNSSCGLADCLMLAWSFLFLRDVCPYVCDLYVVILPFCERSSSKGVAEAFRRTVIKASPRKTVCFPCASRVRAAQLHWQEDRMGGKSVKAKSYSTEGKGKRTKQSMRWVPRGVCGTDSTQFSC